MVLPRRAVAIAGLVFIGAYIYAAGLNYAAEREGAVPELETLRGAIRMEPSNAEYHWRLGRYRIAVQQDASAAAGDFRAAVALNPYVARYWLDLAAAYEVTGDSAHQGEAVKSAVATDPTNPDVTWEAANFYVIRGDMENALPLFRAVVQNDSDLVVPAIRICWAASGHDVNTVLDKVLPPAPDVHFAFLNLLIAESQPDATDQVWQGILSLHKRFNPKLAFPYLDSLREHQRFSDLQRAWEQLVSATPDLKAYVLPNELVVNGGFEYPVLNGGLDWRYTPLPAVDLSIDSNEFHGGARAFCIDFKGPAVEQTGFSQIVPVQPNTLYRFAAYARADEITSASGPRIAVQDAVNLKPLFLTDDFLGTQDWTHVEQAFTTPPATNGVLITVLRSPSDSLIKGRFCLDDVSLAPQPPQGGSPNASH